MQVSNTDKLMALVLEYQRLRKNFTDYTMKTNRQRIADAYADEVIANADALGLIYEVKDANS